MVLSTLSVVVNIVTSHSCGFLMLLRYGEKNHAFTVASFSGDDDKEDVTKKVTSAVERVTSDYHSGSSSDEENSFRETLKLPQRPSTFQVQQVCMQGKLFDMNMNDVRLNLANFGCVRDGT